MFEDLAAEFQLDERIIHKALQKLKSEILDGDKGLCSDLVINAPTLWRLVYCCLQGKQFVQYGKVVFQMNFLQITECDKGAFCHLYSSPCTLTLFWIDKNRADSDAM